VAETSLKWRNTEREQGQLTFDLADFELDWAESLGFDIKAHVLLWGNPPPLASGSGTPEWLRNAFPEETLSTAQREELQRLIRARIAVTVERYRGRIDVWEVTNEMLNPLTSWFVDRLGPEVVDDAFRSAKLADPGAQLVYNEWISDIFTGVGGPDAQAVRDRVIELKQAGVPVDALGQQGHFAPALVNIGVDVDLSERTRIDDYADALEVLAEAGLPIHITEVTFAAPDEPELRAAQAEAIMRIWWGHPQVEEIVFWNFWNPLGPRSRLDLGLYDDDGNLSRHGEAILSLLNDRWRTQVDSSTEQNGAIEFRGTLGRYVAQWETTDGPVSAIFEVVAGPDTLDVVVVSAP
ncbi:MAG: endo-1,4-beta-xylanase, partial [Pseudomonadota bacterium]